jgi:hypothetical protein
LSTPGFRLLVTRDADYDLGVVERKVVDPQVETLGIGVSHMAPIGCQNFFSPAFVTA